MKRVWIADVMLVPWNAPVRTNGMKGGRFAYAGRKYVKGSLLFHVERQKMKMRSAKNWTLGVEQWAEHL
jgi:hypothetical protein